MSTATIRLFLAYGEANRLRTAEISNWSGKALAAPRTEIDAFLAREELEKPGVYMLFGTSPTTGAPACYVGEAETLRDRLKQHRSKDFWVHAVVLVSKDENLTKSHIRYLEGRLISQAQEAERFDVLNAQSSGARLPESDRAEMEEFLGKVAQLLPVLGYDPLTPRPRSADPTRDPTQSLVLRIRGLTAKGRRTESGFLVFEESQAALDVRPSTLQRAPYVIRLREDFERQGVLVRSDSCLTFARDVEFTSPSSAAAVIHGGAANGLRSWKTPDGKTLKDLEATG